MSFQISFTRKVREHEMPWSRVAGSSVKIVDETDGEMASIIEEKALRLMRTLEAEGRLVRRVSIEGRRIEIDLAAKDISDEFERIDMRHGKT